MRRSHSPNHFFYFLPNSGRKLKLKFLIKGIIPRKKRFIGYFVHCLAPEENVDCFPTCGGK